MTPIGRFRIPIPFFAAIRVAPLVAASLAAAFLAGACRRSVSKPQAAASPPAPAQAAPAPASVTAGAYALSPSEKSAVEGFLRQNPNLRVATDEDRRPPDGVEDMNALYGVYHPYFVRGDANDDGILDFVLAFVRRDSDRDSPWFSVVVFSGRADGTFAPGVFLERDTSLAEGDLSLDRDAIVVTPDTGDETTRRYRWDPIRHRHVFVHDSDAEPETPPTAQT